MKYKNALVSVSQNDHLFRKTSVTWPEKFDLIKIDGSNGMCGLEAIFLLFQKQLSYKYVILIDEDVVVENPAIFHKIVDYMDGNKLDIVGLPDADMGEVRKFNPFACNLFLCFIDYQRVLKKFCKKEILNNQFIKKKEFDIDFTISISNTDTLSLKESYYCFFFWLRRKGFRFGYLDSNQDFSENDPITTSIYFNKSLIGHHSWYAREYGRDLTHTQRINNLLSSSCKMNRDGAYMLLKHKTIFTFFVSIFQNIFGRIRLD